MDVLDPIGAPARLQNVGGAIPEGARVAIRRFGAGNLQRFRIVDPQHLAGAAPDTAVPLGARPEEVMVVVAAGPG